MAFHRWSLDSETQSRIVALAPGETLPIMGRCPEPRCRRGVRLEVPGITIIPPDDPWFRFAINPESKYGQPPPRGFVVPTGHGWIGTGAWLTNRARELHVCPEHYRSFTFAGLRPVLVSTAACSADCEEATGADCKCSCGGANHGRAAA